MSAEVLKPLEGEDAIPSVTAEKVASNTGRMVAIVGVMSVALVGIGFGVAHFLHRSEPVVADKQVSSKGTATARAASLKMPEPASAPGSGGAQGSSPTTAANGPVVPSIAPEDGDAKAISLRHGDANPGQHSANGSATGARAAKPIDPDDAPIFAGTPAGPGQQPHVGMDGSDATVGGGGGQLGQPNASRSGADPATEASGRLSVLQSQLGGLMQTLQHRVGGTMGAAGGAGIAGAATNVPTSAITLQSGAAQPKSSLFDSMEKSATPRVSAHMLGDRSMIVAKGTLFLCSLKTRVVSATSGFIGCQTERNVFSDDGKVLLLERGSHLDGEYRVVTIKPGVTRVPVLWTRIRTSKGVVVDLDSPATGQLGESGLDGYVDNRWGERLGAAILLSLIEDAIQYATTPANSTGSTNVVLPNTSTQGSKLAEKVLDTTINIPPLLYQNQGGVVGVYVARDIDFSTVYELRPK
jgi:type IV secretion system protein VirB10